MQSGPKPTPPTAGSDGVSPVPSDAPPSSGGSEATWWTEDISALWVFIPLAIALLLLVHHRMKRNKADFANLLASYPDVSENYLPIIFAFLSALSGWSLEAADKGELALGVTDRWSIFWYSCLAICTPFVYLIGRLWKVSEHYSHGERTRADLAECRMRFIEKANQLFLEVVDEKMRRIRDGIDPLMKVKTAREFLKSLQRTHDPNAQVRALMIATQAVIERHLSEKHLDGLKYRVALFYKDKKMLKVAFAIDGGLRNTKAVSGPRRKNCASFFELREPASEQTFAVFAAYRAAPQVIPDTTDETAARAMGFRYLGDQQRYTIKSILAIPIGLDSASGGACEFLLCVDANLPNAFGNGPAELERFSVIRDNLERRLLIEVAALGLYKKGVSLP